MFDNYQNKYIGLIIKHKLKLSKFNNYFIKTTLSNNKKIMLKLGKIIYFDAAQNLYQIQKFKINVLGKN